MKGGRRAGSRPPNDSSIILPMRPNLIPATLLFALTLPACSTTPRANDLHAHSGRVTHIVILWLNNPTDPAARQKIIDTSYRFRELPGVLAVRAGAVLKSDRPVVDSSYDLAVVMTFVDQQSLHQYETSDAHKRAVNDVLRPLVKKQLVYDFVE